MWIIFYSIMIVAISVVISTIINLVLLKKISEIATEEIKLIENRILKIIEFKK